MFSFFQLITEDKYVVTQQIREASIVIKNTKEPPLTLTIHLTSPLVREEIERAAAGGKLLIESLSVFLSFFLFFLLFPLFLVAPCFQQGGQAGNQPRQILFIGPSMELEDKKCSHIMKVCYAYSSLDTLVVPCNVIGHFWWPNIQYRAGSLLTSEDVAFSSPLMIKVTKEMKAYWEFNQIQKERPLCLHVFYHWWWTVCIAAKMSSKTCSDAQQWAIDSLWCCWAEKARGCR